MILFTWRAALCAIILAVSAPAAIAQSGAFMTVDVKNRVRLEIPSDWSINDAEQRQRIKESTERLMGFTSLHASSFAALSYPKPSRNMVRVSFLPLDPPLTQADLEMEVQSSKRQVLADVASVWQDEAPQMWAGMAKQGVKQVGIATFDVQPFGQKSALTISYARTSPSMPGETMRVTQYHVVLGAEKALITLSHVEGDPNSEKVNLRLKDSFVIR